MKKLGLSLVSCMLLVAFSGCGGNGIKSTGDDDPRTGRTLLDESNISKTLLEQVKTATVRVSADKTGSGFLIDKEGHIVTNNHVIAGQSTLTVYIQDEDGKIDDKIDAQVVATAECADLAVIKLNETYNGSYLNWFTGEITEGRTIGSFGFPGDTIDSYGEYMYTYTEGIISSKTFRKSNSWGSTKSFSHDALISGGNSGGPVVETKTGQVIGINYAGNENGRSFAIAGDFAKDYVDRMMAGENIHSIGIRPIINVDKNGNFIKLGIFVESVETGKHASKIGIKIGDYITSLEGTSLSKTTTLKTYCKILSKNPPNNPKDDNDIGNKLSIEILRIVNPPSEHGISMLTCSGEINGNKPLKSEKAYNINEGGWVGTATNNACSPYLEPLL